MRTGLWRWLVSFSLLSIFGVLTWLPGTAFATTGSSGSPQARVCNAGWRYDILSNDGKVLHQIGPTYQVDNDGPKAVTETLIAQVGGTVRVTASGGLSVDANVIVASVHSQLNITVSVSLTLTIGLKTSESVPAGQSGYARFGVFVQKTYGHYYYLQGDCNIGLDDGDITTWTPRSVGWEIWTGAD